MRIALVGGIASQFTARPGDRRFGSERAKDDLAARAIACARMPDRHLGHCPLVHRHVTDRVGHFFGAGALAVR
jgi:hypothetical protein